jgi:hypothetical protein
MRYLSRSHCRSRHTRMQHVLSISNVLGLCLFYVALCVGKYRHACRTMSNHKWVSSGPYSNTLRNRVRENRSLVIYLSSVHVWSIPGILTIKKCRKLRGGHNDERKKKNGAVLYTTYVLYVRYTSLYTLKSLTLSLTSFRTLW